MLMKYIEANCFNRSKHYNFTVRDLIFDKSLNSIILSKEYINNDMFLLIASTWLLQNIFLIGVVKEKKNDSYKKLKSSGKISFICSHRPQLIKSIFWFSFKYFFKKLYHITYI